MYRLKRYIENLEDRKVNNDIYIKDKVVYINNGNYQYKYHNNDYYILVGEKWINLQGGIPDYETDVEDDIFEKEYEEDWSDNAVEEGNE